MIDITITFEVYSPDNTESWRPNGSALGINLLAVENAFVQISNKIKSMDVNTAYKSFGCKFDSFNFFLGGHYYYESSNLSAQRFMYLVLYYKNVVIKTMKLNVLGIPLNKTIEYILSSGERLLSFSNSPPAPWTRVSTSYYWVKQNMDVDWVQLHDDFVVDFPEVPLPVSNWLKMHMLDQKIYNANAGGKIIEIYEKESNKLVDTVAILGGFITVAGFMKAGSLIAEQPFRDVSNYLKPSTFNEYIMPNYGTASSYVSNLIQNSSNVLGNINKLSINQANVEALKQSTVADIGTATATGTFIYGAMGTLAKNILGAVLKYGKWVLPAADFLYQTDELGVGSDFAYNGITYTAKTRPVVTQTDNWQYQQTVTQHTSDQATTEATAGTTTQADEHQQADTSAQEGKLNELKDSIKGIKEAISSQAKSIVDTLKAMTVNLSIPEGATIPLGFDTVALKDFFTANKLGIDTSAFQEWLGIHGLNINTTSFQEWLGTHGLNIDIEALQTFINTHGLSIDTTALQSILENGLRVDVPNAINLNAPDSINLVAPESIELVADGLKLGLDETATESIRAISDTYKTYAEKVEARENERVTREETKETRDSERWEKEKELVQNEIDNKVTNNEILAVQHSLHTTKAEGLNYAERNIRAWVNEHSQIEFTTKEGLVLKKGLKSNPQLNQQKTYNETQLSEGKIRGKDKFVKELLPTLKAIIPETTEGTIKRFADVNPSMREDFDEIVKSMFVSGVV